ncbi:MAG TPA: hypothetical protein VJH21_03055 [Candidatus Paceibacterota bacterium]
MKIETGISLLAGVMILLFGALTLYMIFFAVPLSETMDTLGRWVVVLGGIGLISLISGIALRFFKRE